MTNITPRFSIKWLILLIIFDFNMVLFLLIEKMAKKHLKFTLSRDSPLEIAIISAGINNRSIQYDITRYI